CFEQAAEERHTPSKAINLADDQRTTMESRGGKRFIEFGSLGFATTLNLGELSDYPPAATIQISPDGRSLRVKTQPASPLSICRYPVIGDELARARPFLRSPTTSLHKSC